MTDSVSVAVRAPVAAAIIRREVSDARSTIDREFATLGKRGNDG